MKNLIIILTTIISISCANTDLPNDKLSDLPQIYGDSTMNEKGKISGLELLNILSVRDSAIVRVEAPITSVCQKKGCWMYVDLDSNNEMLVRFKDYGFFVPMNSEGDTAIIQGLAKVDTLSIAWQKHLKEDANASQEEIESITSPKIIFSINEATAVIIK
jgi:hypothetical protein